MNNLTVSKTDLIKKLKTLEGLTNEERSNLIGLLREHKKYGLVWEDKEEDVEERLREQLPILREVKDKAVLTTSSSGEKEEVPNHILIEGDNLEAITTLSYTHEGKIDVIYIDPPYNTGNKDFVYNDSYVDSEDDYRHSKWLSFMNKRLRIAKRLLSDKGVIFISIDDNEQANLKLLCDSVFGEQHFVANLIWQKKFSRSNDALYFSTMHDHIICYCRKTIAEASNGWKIGLLPRLSEKPKGYSNPDNDPRGLWTSTIMSAKSGSESLLYEIVTPGGKTVTPPSGRYWSCSKETFEQWKFEDRIWFGKDGCGTPRKKTFLSEVQEGLRPNTLILQEEGGNNQEGKQELKAIMDGEGIFDGPKPTKLIKLLLKIANGKELTILDFFAGSGTTLHATMQLNAEDGGHRQCILVTNNENNICEEVTYERNKRVINGYTTPKGIEVEGLHNNTLRYYKTDLIPRERTQRNMRALVEASTDMLCIKEDLYEEQKTFGQLKLKPQLARYFNDGRKHMLIIYREEVIDEIVEEIKSILSTPSTGNEVGKLKVYLFSPGRYAFDDNFYEVADKVQLVALPAAIYDAYMKVLPKRREKMFTEEPKEKKVIPHDLFETREEGGEG